MRSGDGGLMGGGGGGSRVDRRRGVAFFAADGEVALGPLTRYAVTGSSPTHGGTPWEAGDVYDGGNQNGKRHGMATYT